MKRVLSYGLPVVLAAGFLLLLIRYAIESLVGSPSSPFPLLDQHQAHRIFQCIVLGIGVLVFITVVVSLWTAGLGEHYDNEQYLQDEVANIKRFLSRMSGNLPSDRAVCLYNDIRCHVMRAEHYLRTGEIENASSCLRLAHDLRDDIEQVEIYRHLQRG